MKKILIVLILAIVGITGAQAQNETEQVFINAFIEGMDKELASINGGGMRYSGTSLEGKNIICSIIVDEAQFGGMSVKAAFQMIGMDEETFGETMRKELFAQNFDADGLVGLQMLKGYGYKIYFRLIGDPSGEKMNCKVDYEAILK